MSTELPRIWREHWYLFRKLRDAGLKGTLLIYKNAFRALGPNFLYSQLPTASNDNEA
jgi:hypothetical protein